MLKNKLYPYIEKYINEYLYGFTSEQLNVGVMNGTIMLDRLNIRPDRVNEKLDNLEIPIWIKAGRIDKIRISCSLMNFIGEKPLEVVIDDIDLVLTPSFKWIIKNIPTFIEENEFHLKEAYDAMDNNSHDIFSKKVNIYDSSVLKQKEKFYELFQDKSKLSELINRIFTKCLKFYYQKPYLINIKVNNVHLRFEDDQLVNYQNDISLGVMVKSFQMGLSAEGSNKKNNFKVDSVNVYWEPSPRVLIPSKIFLQSLDNENNINEKYYEYLKSVNFNEVGCQFENSKNSNNTKITKNSKHSKCLNIIDNFNCMGNFGIQLVESGNLDFFAQNREKNFKFFLQVATSELNINAYPDIFSIIQRTVDFMKSFYIIEPIQDFKPMRKPYNSIKLSEMLKKNNLDSAAKGSFENKRKMVVRDWFYYLIWFNRFKKAIYGNAFKNPLHAEFSKYFNICCLPANDQGYGHSVNANNHNQFKILNNPSLNESTYRKPSKDNSMIYPEGINTSRDREKSNVDKGKEEDLNPDKINLAITSEILIKGVTVNLHLKYVYNDHEDFNTNSYLMLKLSGLNLKSFISKEKFENAFDIKTFNVSLNNQGSILKIKKYLDEKIKDSILILSSQNQSNNQFQNQNAIQSHSHSSSSLIKSTYTSKMITSTKTNDRINLNLLPSNKFNMNESFTSDAVSVFNAQNNYQEHGNNNFSNFNNFNDNTSLFSRERDRDYTLTQTYSMNNMNNYNNFNDPNLNKKINVLNDTLDQMTRRRKEEVTSRNKSKDYPFFKNKINIVNLLLTDDQGGHTMNIDEKPNKINLSKVINDYNKTIIKQKKSIIINPKDLKDVKDAKEKINYSSTVPNEDERVNLYLLEMSNNSQASVINFKISKTQNKETINIQLGSSRINLSENYLNFLISIIEDYNFAVYNLNKFKLDSQNLKNLNNEKRLLNLKNLIYGKITSDKNFSIANNIPNKKVESILGVGSNPNPNQTTQTEVNDYISYLKRDLSGIDKKLLDEANFEVNYIFGFLNKNLEINFVHQDINIIFLTKDLNNLLSKLKLPNLNIKFQLNLGNKNKNNFISDEQETQIYLKFMDFEMSMNDLNEAQEIIKNFLMLAEEKLKTTNFIYLEPVIKKLTEESRINAIMEANNNLGNINSFNSLPRKNSNFQSQHNIMNNLNLNLNPNSSIPLPSKKGGHNPSNMGVSTNMQSINQILQNNIQKESEYTPIKSDRAINNNINKEKFNINSNLYSKNIESSKATVVNTEKDKLPTFPGNNFITDNQYTETIQCDDLNSEEEIVGEIGEHIDDDISSPSDIINLENSAENISEYEDLGIIIEKSKINDSNKKESLIVKNIQSFNNFNRDDKDLDKNREKEKIKIFDQEQEQEEVEKKIQDHGKIMKTTNNTNANLNSDVNVNLNLNQKSKDKEANEIKESITHQVNQVKTPNQKISNPLNNLNFNLVKPTNPGHSSKKSFTSITANKTSSSGVKLKVKNTGNINHMNINIK